MKSFSSNRAASTSDLRSTEVTDSSLGYHQAASLGDTTALLTARRNSFTRFVRIWKLRHSKSMSGEAC